MPQIVTDCRVHCQTRPWTYTIHVQHTLWALSLSHGLDTLLWKKFNIDIN